MDLIRSCNPSGWSRRLSDRQVVHSAPALLLSLLQIVTLAGRACVEDQYLQLTLEQTLPRRLVPSSENHGASAQRPTVLEHDRLSVRPEPRDVCGTEDFDFACNGQAVEGVLARDTFVVYPDVPERRDAVTKGRACGDLFCQILLNGL